MDLILLPLVFIVGFLTAIIGVMVGGSGLMRIPVLILLGLPPQVAVATNKAGSISLTLVGLYKYGKEKLVNLKIGSIMAVIEVFGAIIGSYILLSIDEAILNRIIALVIFSIVLLVIMQRNVGIEKIKRIPKKNWMIGVPIFFFISIYGGFIGGGVGTVQMYVLAYLFGLTFLESIATRRIPNLLGLLISVSIFAFYGIIDWTIAAVLFVGEGMGAWVGASIAIKRGDRFVKTLFIIVSIALALKLILI